MTEEDFLRRRHSALTGEKFVPEGQKTSCWNMGFIHHLKSRAKREPGFHQEQLRGRIEEMSAKTREKNEQTAKDMNLVPRDLSFLDYSCRWGVAANYSTQKTSHADLHRQHLTRTLDFSKNCFVMEATPKSAYAIPFEPGGFGVTFCL